MTKMTLAALAAVIVAGCAAPVAREASMDWPAFIASVPGTVIGDAEYKTPTLKRSAYRANTPGLEQTKASFGAWCQAHGGKALNVPLPQTGGVAQSFYAAVSAWANQELVLYGQRYGHTTLLCLDGKASLTGPAQLIAVMLVRTYSGYRNGPYEPEKLPAPVIAFYTPEQASKFADFYNAREKERAEESRKDLQQRMEREAADTRRLRAEPKIGDKTNQGIIIDLRPPLALIQYDAMQRQMFGKPQQEWVPISSLVAPR
ncbi:hypothetical protein [Aquabacterium parvum]|jgi:hypothetical protein|uniref:hypothetical protein n=1 Tax=Aquabacterium parvum TaxID=70584 RepID=UPI00128EF9EA|nr:hypothetical protein [Aquabacterium parvum]MBU0915560.1 hypothetical protein [Gammaproteobacteria bacterium]